MADGFDYELAFRRLRARGDITITPTEFSRGYGEMHPVKMYDFDLKKDVWRNGQTHLGYDPGVKIEFKPHKDSPGLAKTKREWYGKHGRIGPFMAGFFFSEFKKVERPTLREAMEELLEKTRPMTGDLYEMVLEKRDHDRDQDAHAAIWDAVAIGLVHGEYAA